MGKRGWEYRRGPVKCKTQGCLAIVTTGMGSRLGLCVPCAKENKKRYNREYGVIRNKTQTTVPKELSDCRLKKYPTINRASLMHAETIERFERIADEYIKQIWRR